MTYYVLYFRSSNSGRTDGRTHARTHGHALKAQEHHLCFTEESVSEW